MGAFALIPAWSANGRTATETADAWVAQEQMHNTERSRVAAENHMQHRALVYRDSTRFIDAVTAFVRNGLDKGDRVLIAVPTDKRAALEDALGDAAGSVEWADAHTRSGSLFREVIDFLALPDGPEAAHVRIVSEQPLQQRSEAERRAHMRYEAAANVAYEPFAVSVLCPFDASQLPDEAIRDVLSTHPDVIAHDQAHASTAFVDPREFIRLHSQVRPPPPGAPNLLLEDVKDLAGARSLVADRAAAAGLGAERIEDLQVAVSEAATNALLHGAPPCCLWLYEEEQMLVCHVRDGGDGLADPLAGYLPPERHAEGGRGLWITHQICDVVETSANDTGSHVYLGVRL